MRLIGLTMLTAIAIAAGGTAYTVADPCGVSCGSGYATSER